MKRFLTILVLLTCGICRGQHWSQIYSPTNQKIFSCSFINQDTGWIVTANNIFRTNDGGFSWTNQNYPPDPTGDNRFFNTIQFINPNNGIIACGNYAGPSPTLSTILWTNDGGINWVYKDIGDSDDYEIDAKLVNPNTAFAIGQYGTSKKTINNATTWTSLDFFSGSGAKLFPINNDTVYFAGVTYVGASTIGIVGKTMDGGSTWNTYSNPTNIGMQTIYFNDYFNGWVGGFSGEIRYTIDAGLNWTLTNTGVTSCINDLVFTNSTNGWAVTSDGDILNSTDAGHNWNIQFTTSTYLTSLSFSRPNEIGYAVGDSGKIFKYSLNVGFETLTNNVQINIFPNPITNELNIKIDNYEPAEITLYDLASRKLLQQTFTNTTTINTEQLAKGMYLYEVRNRNGIIKNGKVIKE